MRGLRIVLGEERAVKPARQLGPLPHVRYRPEVTTCPHCGADLVYSHPVWAKAIQFLTGIEHVTNLGFRCGNPACAFGRTVYRSAAAEARQVKGSGYGLDVVVRIGHVRFTEHRTRGEIWHQLQAAGVRISERHVQNLLEVYLALLRASEHNLTARLTTVAAEHGGIILALDGLQPEKGNEQFWLVREVLSGTVLAADNLREASAPALCTLLRPVIELGVPVLGVISDAQESIRLAVAESFPGVPHQLCQFHVLRDAARPLWEADRHLLVEAKKGLGKVREVERRLQRQERRESRDEVVEDAVLALRQITREHGTAPLDFAGLRAMEALEEISQTLNQCLAKRGTRDWPACENSSLGPWSTRRDG